MIHAIRHEIGELRADMTLRFDEAAASSLAIQTRIDAVELGIRTHIDDTNTSLTNAIKDSATESITAINTVREAVSGCQKHLTDQLLKARDNIQSGTNNANSAIKRLEEYIKDGHKIIIEKFTSTVESSANSVVKRLEEYIKDGHKRIIEKVTFIMNSCEKNIKDSVDKAYRAVKEVGNQAITVEDIKPELKEVTKNIINNTNEVDELRHEALDKRLTEVQNAITEDVDGRQNETRTHIDESLQHVSESITTMDGNFNNSHNNIETALGEVRLEVRVGHLNSAIRLANKLSSCCNSSILPLRDINNGYIRRFPTTYSRFQSISSSSLEVDRLLYRLGLSFDGNSSDKQRLLKAYVGLRK